MQDLMHGSAKVDEETLLKIVSKYVATKLGHEAGVSLIVIHTSPLKEDVVVTGIVIERSGAEDDWSAKGRLPLSISKQKLIEFLSRYGSATRVEINRETGIPLGSLSTILSDEEFVQSRRGVW